MSRGFSFLWTDGENIQMYLALQASQHEGEIFFY